MSCRPRAARSGLKRSLAGMPAIPVPRSTARAAGCCGSGARPSVWRQWTASRCRTIRREWFVEELKYDDGAEPKAEYFTFIVLPPGEFQMGSPDTEPGRQDDEVLHPVRLTHGFAICDREITAAQFLRVPTR